MNLIWKNPEEFRNATLGKRIDVDNFPKEQPYQCWDLPAFFWSRVVGRFLATKQGGPASASQSAGITGVSHRARPKRLKGRRLVN